MRFIVTDELGRLSKWLRILGFDTLVEKDRRSLVIKSLRDDRIILTRDSKMSRFTGARMVKIRSDFVEKQLEQVFEEVGFRPDPERLFSLCVICNENLESVRKDSVKDAVPRYVFETQKAFMRCPGCGKIYWHGTHWALVNRFLSEVKKEA
jgi:uncharacterized protein with PIN domain